MKSYSAIVLIVAFGLQVMATTGTDNSKINTRDRQTKELTADQQSYGQKDTDLVRRIRKDIMKEPNFSTYAQNVKIIAVRGTVTLKGPVRSAREEASILKYARAAAGDSNIRNEISIVPTKK